MTELCSIYKNGIFQRGVGLVAIVTFLFITSATARVNHPVFVEGNCLVSPAGSSSVTTTGTCGDYDGDGKIGTDEDNDGDRVFGTITGANSAAGINNNGTITIVRSGVFPEKNLTLRGNVTLQAAKGVNATIDAVLQGDADNTARQNGNGIYVSALSDRRVVIRNITIKNYRRGIFLVGASRATIESVKVENNIDYGIRAGINVRLSISNSSVIATGYRLNATEDFPSVNPPSPGVGISIEASARASITSTTVSNNFAEGIRNTGGGAVCVALSNVFNNGTNISNTGAGSITTGGTGCY